jgi:GDPmannose 4,6-dehydratase
MTKRALITGITGQDGSYLAEWLLSKDYKVFGLVRRLSKPNTDNIKGILDKVELVEGDLTDQSSLLHAVKQAEPDELYNLASQSFVKTSWTQPELTANITGVGALRVFEAARQACPLVRIYQASSSEMFGNMPGPQNEETPMHPRSPYGVAKLFAHRMAKVYRDSYGMFISCGILFNHESPRRGIEFVTRKIAHAVARIEGGKQDKLVLGDISAQRDWGYAPDYVKAMWLMLQHKNPEDFVIATGEQHSVSEFVVRAFEHVRLDWKDYVDVDKKYMRPAELYSLRGDAKKAKEKLGWTHEVGFEELVSAMVDSELREAGLAKY